MGVDDGLLLSLKHEDYIMIMYFCDVLVLKKS